MTKNPSVAVADALGLILQRRFRTALYDDLVRDVHEALDVAAYPVISGVARTGPISAAALGEEIGLDRSIVTRRAARLIAAGLLESSPDPRDARAALLSLSPAGTEVISTLRRRLVAAIERRLASWPTEDRTRLAELLARFAADPLR